MVINFMNLKWEPYMHPPLNLSFATGHWHSLFQNGVDKSILWIDLLICYRPLTVAVLHANSRRIHHVTDRIELTTCWSTLVQHTRRRHSECFCRWNGGWKFTCFQPPFYEWLRGIRRLYNAIGCLPASAHRGKLRGFSGRRRQIKGKSPLL